MAALDYISRKGVRGPMVDWIRLEGAEVMQRLGRWQEVTGVVDRVRSGAVMGVFGHLYEITFAVQLAMQGRYEESEQHLKKAEEIAPAIRDPQAIAPMIGIRMRLLLARGNYDVGGAVEQIEPMINDPLIYHVVPLIARVEAAASLVAHDPDAPSRIERLVSLLRGVRDTVEPGGLLGEERGTWLSLTEAELSRACGDVHPTLWRDAVARIQELVHVDFEL